MKIDYHKTFDIQIFYLLKLECISPLNRTQCGGTYTTQTGVLRSPGYPDPYPHSRYVFGPNWSSTKIQKGKQYNTKRKTENNDPSTLRSVSIINYTETQTSIKQ